MVEKIYTYTKDGKIVSVYNLTNKNGASMQMLDYGARIISLCVPDKNGAMHDVIVGFQKPEEYLGDVNYFGATVGRFCNRIENATFWLNGREYRLEKNDGENCLHGGKTAGFDKVVWDVEIKGDGICFSHFSPDGEGGFPGNFTATATYTLTDDNCVIVEFVATSDKDTVCNLTQHAYFNLGYGDTVLDHQLYIDADAITDCDEKLIPHGKLLDVRGTPLSFNPPKKIGQDINADHPLIKACGGYDFNYCTNKNLAETDTPCARLYSADSRIVMECFSTLPGLQLYTANGTGGVRGKKNYKKHCAVCLETQFYPNSPNCPTYPSTVLGAGETYKHKTIYKFLVAKE